MIPVKLPPKKETNGEHAPFFASRFTMSVRCEKYNRHGDLGGGLKFFKHIFIFIPHLGKIPNLTRDITSLKL